MIAERKKEKKLHPGYFNHEEVLTNNLLRLEKKIKLTTKFCEYEAFREKVIKIINEHLKNDGIINLIKGYASREIDNRKLKSSDKWTTILISAGVSSLVAISAGIVIHFLD